MRPLSILINGYEGRAGEAVLSRGFRGMPIQYCGVLNRKKEDAPVLQAEEYEWHGPSSLANCDWEDIAPIDESLVERMRECEAVCIEMLSRREAQGRTFTYSDRKRLYLKMLRYWNHMLEEKKINLFLSYDVPHRLRPYVIYMLCKEKGIPTLICTHADPLHDYIFFFSDWENPVPELSRVKSRQKLPKNFQCYLEDQEVLLHDDDAKPWPKSLAPLHLHFWRRRAIHLYRLLKAKSMFRFYDRHAEEPDLTKRFIYLPLQLQPECSTCPMAGAYVDQLLIAQMLGALLPPDVMIYVKEHPAQQRKHPDGKCRSLDFYKDLLAVRNIRFVPRSFSSFTLMENCTAVATPTGTAGFECLFMGKPTLLFGHRYFQDAPGVFQIRSTEDCHSALKSILEGGAAPNKEDLLLYLSKLSECAVYGYTDLRRESGSHLSHENNTESVGAVLEREIRARVAMPMIERTTPTSVLHG